MLMKERIAYLDTIAREAIDALEGAGTAADAVAKLRGQLLALDKLMPSKASIPITHEVTERDEKVAELYEQGYSLLEVGRRCGIGGPTTVSRILRKQGVTIRPKGRGYYRTGTGPDLDRIGQIREYLGNGDTLTDIGRRMGITRERVRQICVKNGISTAHQLKPEQKEWARKYAEGEGSLQFLAERAGVGQHLMRSWVLRAGYEIASKPHASSAEVQRRTVIAAELYGQGMRVVDIAKRIGVGKPESVYRYLNIAGVKRDRKGRGRQPVNRPKRVWTEEKKEQLVKLYAEGLSYGKIAKELGVTRSAVCGQLWRLGLNHSEKEPSRETQPENAEV